MKDWAGNEFKDGDIMVAVVIKPPPIMDINIADSRTGFVKVEIKQGAEWIWEPYLKCPVTEIEGEKYAVIFDKQKEDFIYVPEKFILQNRGRFVALCIEGKSDNEREFFKHWFKPGDN